MAASDTGLTILDAGADAVDAGPIDGGLVDAGPVDAGTVDAGTVDAGTVDAGTHDAGPTVLPIVTASATTVEVFHTFRLRCSVAGGVGRLLELSVRQGARVFARRFIEAGAAGAVEWDVFPAADWWPAVELRCMDTTTGALSGAAFVIVTDTVRLPRLTVEAPSGSVGYSIRSRCEGGPGAAGHSLAYYVYKDPAGAPIASQATTADSAGNSIGAFAADNRYEPEVWIRCRDSSAPGRPYSSAVKVVVRRDRPRPVLSLNRTSANPGQIVRATCEVPASWRDHLIGFLAGLPSRIVGGLQATANEAGLAVVEFTVDPTWMPKFSIICRDEIADGRPTSEWMDVAVTP